MRTDVVVRARQAVDARSGLATNCACDSEAKPCCKRAKTAL